MFEGNINCKSRMQHYDDVPLVEQHFLIVCIEFLPFDINLYQLPNKISNILHTLHELKRDSVIDLVLIQTPETEGRGVLPRLYDDKMYMFVQEPGQIFSPTYFIAVFHSLMWISFAAILLMTTSFIFIHNYTLQLNKKQFCETLLHISGISPSVNLNTSTISYKLCVITFSMLVICFAASFSAFLTTELSISKFDLPFKSFEELKTQSDYSLCVGKMTSSFRILFEDKNIHHILNTKRCKDFINDNYAEFSEESFKIMCNDSRTVYLTTEWNANVLQKKLAKYDGSSSLLITSTNKFYIFHLQFMQINKTEYTCF